MVYSDRKQPQLLSKHDIAMCVGCLELDDFKGVYEKSIGLAQKLRQELVLLKAKRKLTVDDDACRFFMHEMNNLLSPVVGYSQMAYSGNAPEGISPMKLRGMIGAYLGICLDFVDVFLGIKQPRERDECIEDMLERTKAMTLYFENKMGIRFSIPTERHYVHMGFVTFFQIALNIMKNAVRAGAENMYIVSTSSEGGDYVRVDFANDGKSIPPEIAEAVFRKDFTTKKEGNGIGLAACREFAEKAGGTMSADLSTYNTCFYMELPVVKEREHLEEMVGV